MRTWDRPRYRVHYGPGSNEQTENRIVCAICGFPGVSPYARPGESTNHEGSVSIAETGTTYVWDSPDEPTSNQDYEAVVTPNSMRACPDCGGERFLDGRRGSAHSVRRR